MFSLPSKERERERERERDRETYELASVSLNDDDDIEHIMASGLTTHQLPWYLQLIPPWRTSTRTLDKIEVVSSSPLILISLRLSLSFFPFSTYCPVCVNCWSPAVSVNICIKGSVERSLLPWAIFLIFTQNRPWKSEDHLCMLFFIEMSKERLEKAKEHRQFRGVLGRWRTAAIDRTTFHACQRCRKTAVFAVSPRIWGVIWRAKAFRHQQCQFLTRNKSLSSENESNCSMASECVRTDLILPWGAGLEHGRYKQSIFSLSIFGILVERLSF